MTCENLKWIRIFDPIHIPREYVEQIKDRVFEVDKFYDFQKMICKRFENGVMHVNEYNLLFVLVDESNLVKGFCWMVVDPLANALVINNFSMDKEFWGKGRCIRLLEQKAKEIQEGAQLDRVYWITRCPKHSEKYGFKKSKHVLMEYINHGRIIQRHNDGIGCETDGPSESLLAPTNAILSTASGRPDGECARCV